MKDIANNLVFKELVRDIEVIMELKEKLILLYYNMHLKQWVHLFKRPESIMGRSKVNVNF
jgi:hypothetical protein